MQYLDFVRATVETQVQLYDNVVYETIKKSIMPYSMSFKIRVLHAYSYNRNLT